MGVRASLLYYDIPDDIKFPNPSPILRRIGVRVNLSVWVIPTALTPYNLLHRMDTKGISRNVVEFSEKEADNLVAIARAAFAEQARKAANSAQRTANVAANEADENAMDAAQAAHHVDARVKAATRKGEKLLADLIAAADGFGLMPDDFAAPDAFSQLRIIRSMSVAKARLFAKATRKIKAIGGYTGNGLSLAAERDQLPPGIASDFLRDNGDDETADELLEQFT